MSGTKKCGFLLSAPPFRATSERAEADLRSTRLFPALDLYADADSRLRASAVGRPSDCAHPDVSPAGALGRGVYSIQEKQAVSILSGLHHRSDLSVETLVRYYKLRWGFETNMRDTKEELGFDQYQVHSQRSIERSVLLSFVAASLTQ